MNRRISWTCLLFILAACGGTSEGTDGGVNGGGGGGGGNPDGGSNPLPDGGNPGGDGGSNGFDAGLTATPAAFRGALGAAYCQRAVQCGEVADAAIPACAETVSRAFEVTNALVRAADAGRYQFQPAKGQSCLTELAALPCPFFETSLPQSCAETFAPAVQLGGVCGATAECVQGDCRGDAGCDGRCVAVGQLGQPCDNGNFCDDPNAYCQLDAGRVCAPKRDAGTCDECDQRIAYCDFNNVCHPLPVRNEACGPFGQCADGLYCEAGASCQLRADVGQNCAGNASCRTGLFCNGQARCETQKAVGAPCVDITGECLAPPETLVQCDEVLRTCQTRTIRSSGESCTNDLLVCRGGLCDGVRSNDDGGLGVVGLCRAYRSGDECLYPEQCDWPLECLNPDGGAFDLSGQCGPQKVDAGRPCGEDVSICGTNHLCAGGRCHPAHQLSETCETDFDLCGSGLKCLPSLSDAGTVCRPRGDLNEPCVPGGQSECRLGLSCSAAADGGVARCVPAGLLGQPCSEEFCFEGACAPSTDGGTLSTCAAVGPGVLCSAPQQCESGRCNFITGECIAACF